MKMNPSKEMNEEFIRFQRSEKARSIVCERPVSTEKDESNCRILHLISAEEKVHYATLKKYIGTGAASDWMRIAEHYQLARILGITFAVKLMELSEEDVHHDYVKYTDFPDLQQLAKEEEIYKQKLIGLINEERFEYMGSVVLGLNGVLIEFTGILAGLTLALSDSRLIALIGSTTEIATVLSMIPPEYLSTRLEGGEDKHPIKAAIYTGIACVITVMALVAPPILIKNVLIVLGVASAMALMVIALFNCYYSVTHGENFCRRFTEMAVLGFSVAGVNFLIGYALKTFAGIDA